MTDGIRFLDLVEIYDRFISSNSTSDGSVMQTSDITTTTPESTGKPMKDEESRSITSRSPREISYRQSAAGCRVKERQWHMAVTYSALFKCRPARRPFFQASVNNLS